MAIVLETPPSQMTEPATNPRKRKKRAPAAGAANDCFKCAQHKITCDRRRPYCSQCLESGGDCPGYKTQLTWGVGVASRGKLRGLSLPIAGTEKAVLPKSQAHTKKRRDTGTERPSSRVRPSFAPEDNSQFHAQHIQPGVPAATVSPDTPTLVFPSQHGAVWDPTLFSAPHAPHPRTYSINSAHSDQRSVYQLAGSMSTPQRSHQQSPVSHQPNAWPEQGVATSAYLDPNSIMAPATTSHQNTMASYLAPNNSFAMSPGLVSPGQLTFPDPSDQTGRLHESGLDGISMLLQAGQSMQPRNEDAIEEVEDVDRNIFEECAAVDDMKVISTSSPVDFKFSIPILPGLGSIGKTTRMQYLINYYAEVISPVIVAFDSPNNPFRTQILRLAEGSETLQHAISALAASNVRQRRGIGLLSTGKTAPARRSSFAHVHLTNDYSQTLLSPEEQIREETLHKRLAVSQLNQQLAHPVLRKDDSILATLLILCLFHICDSGIAKFQTQFAGVRKLLALRGDSMKIGNEESKWMARLFTWFDSLAATVNDREGQISGEYLDISAMCGDWALENMAGIDAHLFRSISRLGRLNLLKHGKAVEAVESMTAPLPPLTFNADIYATLDGNGWVRHDSGSGLGISEDETDGNKQFWQEWQEVRRDLLSWSLDTTLFDSMSSESSYLTPEQRMDMENISQSFRYSALLYTERLAQPQLPSSDEAIQRWVRQSLRHIKQVVSDVYLLWPLFITGTECITEDERDIIRGRCQDIQKDSGFVNNASCLLLLEKVWRASSPHASPSSDGDEFLSPSGSESSTGSAFTFRDVMMREAARTEGEGEYIVI